MTEFPSWLSYHHFSNSVMRETRFFRDREAQGFLDTVLATSKSRQKNLPNGTVLWRCQSGHSWRMHKQGDEVFEVPDFFPKNRMKPTTQYASNGRVNPKGITCLYLASECDTAIAEVRPWIGSMVTVSQFKTTQDLKIIDFASDEPKVHIYFKEPKPERREKAVWAAINKSFSEPISRNEDIQRYVPTQILAELFKSNGFDGLAYRSNFGENGINIALFDVNSAETIKSQLYKVKNIKISSSEEDNPVFWEKNSN